MDQALAPLNQAVWELLVNLWPLWVFLITIGLFKLALTVYQQRRLARSGIYDVDQMTGPLFEQYLATLFRHLDYQVQRTGKTGDYGADLVISKNGVRTIVQAKRYTKNVGVKAVQEAVAAKGMYRCTAAMVVTNSNYTQPAQKLARVNQVELWDRQRLITVMLSVRDKTGMAPIEPSPDASP